MACFHFLISTENFKKGVIRMYNKRDLNETLSVYSQSIVCSGLLVRSLDIRYILHVDIKKCSIHSVMTLNRVFN